jgi:hypothetical protein
MLSPGIGISFFDTEEAHAVVLAQGVDRGGPPSPSRDRDGIGRRDETGMLSCFGAALVSVDLSKVLSSQVWARGDLPLR